MQRSWSGSTNNNDGEPTVDMLVDGSTVRLGVHNGDKGCLIELSNKDIGQLIHMLQEARVNRNNWLAHEASERARKEAQN